jgi:OmpA-OmpF porin, OOP family
MRTLVAVLACTILPSCSKSVAVDTTPTPIAEPTPPPEPEPEPEPEEEVVVAQEPKSLEIQRDVIRLRRGIRIQFETNKADLLPASFEILDEVASVMEQNQRIRIRVEGHTDNVGKADYNQDLSTRRAASVRAYLTQKGIAEERLESTGCGQNVPIADNATDEGKQENRRVEFVILRRRRAAEPCRLYTPRGERRRDRGGDAGGAPDAAPTTP